MIEVPVEGPFVAQRLMILMVGLLPALFMAALAGCNQGDGRPAKEYKFSPVKGRVLAGDQPMTQGTIDFLPVNDPNFVASGEIKADGTFVLSTKMPGKTSPGAPEGEYRVAISVPQPPGHKGSPIGPFGVAENVTVKPGENDLTLKIPPVKLP